MTTIRQLVLDGFRESGITPVGTEPTGDEFDEGFRKLQGIIKSLFGNELGEQLSTQSYGNYGLTNAFASAEDQSGRVNSVYIPNNTRLVFNVNSSNTLYLHPNPDDGARFGVIDNVGNFLTFPQTINGNGRHIELAGSVTLNTNLLNNQWFYRADLGSWVKVLDLVASDQSPLPSEFDEYLTSMLAMRINPRFGAQTDPELNDILSRMKRQFRSRYRQKNVTGSELALILIPSNQYARNYFIDRSDFDVGRI
jgi:hypothetical protein